ncbi:hypothetical protein ACJJTC_005652 [Scirpophaga incertulas]
MVQEHRGIKFKPKQGLRGLNSEKSGIFGHLGFSDKPTPLGGYPGSRPTTPEENPVSLRPVLFGSCSRFRHGFDRGPKPAPPCRGGREHPEKSKHRYSTVPGCGENPSQTSGLTAGGHLGEISSGHISGPRDPRECSERQGKDRDWVPSPKPLPQPPIAYRGPQTLYRNGMKCLNDSRNIKTEIKDQTKEAIKGLFNIVKSAEVEREKRQAEQKMKEEQRRRDRT